MLKDGKVIYVPSWALKRLEESGKPLSVLFSASSMLTVFSKADVVAIIAMHNHFSHFDMRKVDDEKTLPYLHGINCIREVLAPFDLMSTLGQLEESIHSYITTSTSIFLNNLASIDDIMLETPNLVQDSVCHEPVLSHISGSVYAMTFKPSIEAVSRFSVSTILHDMMGVLSDTHYSYVDVCNTKLFHRWMCAL